MLRSDYYPKLIREYYKEIKDFQNGFQTRTTVYKNKDRVLNMDVSKYMETWTVCFSD